MTGNIEEPHIGSESADVFSLANVPGSRAVTHEAGGHKPKQYNFARHWRRKIAPHLDDPGVVKTLTLGLKLYDKSYNEGDPPWLVGRGPLNGQRAREGCLSWYQPWGRCHHIAPFSWVLGHTLYPDLKWGFLSGQLHTVVIGWSDSWEEPEWVMDILLFREMNAVGSIDFVKKREWKFHDSLPRYLASFFSDSEDALAEFVKIIDQVRANWEEGHTVSQVDPAVP